MADTLDITEGTGTTIATQDEAGIHYQEVKLTASGTGTTEALSKAEDSGHTSGEHGIMALTVRQNTAASLSGTDADYQPLITDTNGRLHVLDQNSAAILTALQIIDDWDDSDKCNVNINVAGTDVAANAGVLNAQTLRVTIATDDECNNYLGTIDADTGAIKTAVEALDNAVDGNYLNCNLNIAGTDVSANAGTLTAQTLRVTIATDDECNNFLGTIDADTGAIKTATELIDDAIYIDDADWSDGSSKHMLVGGLYQSTPQTVTDGDVAPIELDSTGKIIESNSADIKTALEIIDDWDDSDYCNVNMNVAGTDVAGNAGTLNAQTIRVTIATDDECNNFLGTIDADTGNIVTAVQIMDDWDATHASAAPADGAQVMGAAYSTALPTDVGADADAARLVTDRYGRLCTGLQPQAAKATLDNADTTTAREVVAATASRKIYVTSLILSVDTAGNYWLEDGDATQVTGKFYLAANGGVAITFPEGTPLNTVTVNKALNVKGSTSGNVSVTVTYYLAV